MSTSVRHDSPASTRGRRALSWGVHLFTATGGVLGALALLELSWGTLDRAAILVLVALAIDSMDGAFARLVGVSEHLPWMNGRRLDDMIDFLNFVVVGVVFMVAAGSLVSPYWIAAPILASAYGFSRDDAKTEDHFFVGFPSYWNILALYLWKLDVSPMQGTIWVAALSILVFVPFKYVYPSRMPNLVMRYTTSYAGMLWAIVFGWAILDPEWAERVHAIEWSLLYPAYYMVLSLKYGGLHRRPPDAT